MTGRGGMPFEAVKPQPNAETLAAMLNEMEIHPKRYKSSKGILAETGAEKDENHV